jgi:hypothetical protein
MAAFKRHTLKAIYQDFQKRRRNLRINDTAGIQPNKIGGRRNFRDGGDFKIAGFGDTQSNWRGRGSMRRALQARHFPRNCAGFGIFARRKKGKP